MTQVTQAQLQGRVNAGLWGLSAAFGCIFTGMGAFFLIPFGNILWAVAFGSEPNFALVLLFWMVLFSTIGRIFLSFYLGQFKGKRGEG